MLFYGRLSHFVLALTSLWLMMWLIVCGRLQEFLGHKEHIYLCIISKYFTVLLIKFPLMEESILTGGI